MMITDHLWIFGFIYGYTGKEEKKKKEVNFIMNNNNDFESSESEEEQRTTNPTNLYQDEEFPANQMGLDEYRFGGLIFD